ncbi:DUF2922 family protein [Enterococcus hulanensis]|uniref:DUF2922 family protein n=1 Tax=Enterococcus hulanensis TaxID=2559929 RepID=UPI0010F6801A|nr:DUF2922 family protein [Enterococcus hulanensis]MBO0459903.1 DUF2922 family protein [Enterococcus hulanensis]MDT2662682.1 DUF2922 family protein [Enterococcus hulanensis]
MKKLVAIFKTKNGRSQTWSYPNADDNKSNDEVRGTLERLTLLNLFDKNGDKLFDQVTSAKFVETVERIVF